MAESILKIKSVDLEAKRTMTQVMEASGHAHFDLLLLKTMTLNSF